MTMKIPGNQVLGGWLLVPLPLFINFLFSVRCNNFIITMCVLLFLFCKRLKMIYIVNYLKCCSLLTLVSFVRKPYSGWISSLFIAIISSSLSHGRANLYFFLWALFCEFLYCFLFSSWIFFNSGCSTLYFCSLYPYSLLFYSTWVRKHIESSPFQLLTHDC